MESIKAVNNGVLCTLGLWMFSTAVVIIQFLSLFIWPFSKKLYHAFHAHMMRQWAQNLFQVMRLFAPGDLIVTMDESCTEEATEISDELDDPERDNDKLERLLTRNKNGQVTGISFPERLVMISNHQVRRGRKRTYSFGFVTHYFPQRFMQIGFTFGSWLIYRRHTVH